MRTLQSWANNAETALQNIFHFPLALRAHTSGQAVGACPHCRDGTDRFVVYQEGNWWCRVCKKKGWWLEEAHRPAPGEIEARRLATEQERIQLRTKIATCRDWVDYHNQVGQGMNSWATHGIDRKDIDRWGLGYCLKAPGSDSPSLTIPVFYKQKLVDIRHRLLNPLDGQKYRSHWSGLPPAFFNLDSMGEGDVVYLVEGEKKAVVLEHHGFHPVISYPGQNTAHLLPEILLREGTVCQKLRFLPDPHTEDSVYPVIRSLQKDGFECGLVDLFEKPDDFVIAYGGNALRDALKYWRRL